MKNYISQGTQDGYTMYYLCYIMELIYYLRVDNSASCVPIALICDISIAQRNWFWWDAKSRAIIHCLKHNQLNYLPHGGEYHHNNNNYTYNNNVSYYHHITDIDGVFWFWFWFWLILYKIQIKIKITLITIKIS